jgi:hypothetical protein
VLLRYSFLLRSSLFSAFTKRRQSLPLGLPKISQPTRHNGAWCRTGGANRRSRRVQPTPNSNSLAPRLRQNSFGLCSDPW